MIDYSYFNMEKNAEAFHRDTEREKNNVKKTICDKSSVRSDL